jgi:hypothetical protein
VQVVGKLCIHCQERISRELDGQLCSRCGSPVHFECVRRVFQSPSERCCRECAAPREVVKAAAKAEEQREEATEARDNLTMMVAGMALLVFGLTVSLLCTGLSFASGREKPVVWIWAIGGGGILVLVGLLLLLTRSRRNR